MQTLRRLVIRRIPLDKSSNPLTNNEEVWSDAQKNQYSLNVLNVSETLRPHFEKKRRFPIYLDAPSVHHSITQEFSKSSVNRRYADVPVNWILKNEGLIHNWSSWVICLLWVCIPIDRFAENWTHLRLVVTARVTGTFMRFTLFPVKCLRVYLPFTDWPIATLFTHNWTQGNLIARDYMKG